MCVKTVKQDGGQSIWRVRDGGSLDGAWEVGRDKVL